MNSNQQAESAYKKLKGLATTGLAGTVNARFPFNEPFVGPLAINPQQIWVEQHLIPNTAPLGMTNGQIVGVVQRFIDLRLKSVAGTTNSFYHENLKDCLPHVYGDQFSYNLLLKDGSGTQIVFGQGDWEIDYEAGVLTFFGTVPAGVGTTYPTNTPQISFFRYVGAKGNSVLYLSGAEISSTSGTSGADSYQFSGPINTYTSNAVYILRPTHSNTGPVYVNINGLGYKQVMKVNDNALLPLSNQDIEANINYILIYDKFNGVFQLSSGTGSGNGTNTSSTMVVELTAPGSINYEVLGFAEIGSAQFYRKDGNNYILVIADIEIQHIAKTITVNTLDYVNGILRIVGTGDVVSSGTAGSSAPYFNDLVDLDLTNVQVGDSVYYNGTNWTNNFTVNQVINTSYQNIKALATANQLKTNIYYRFPHQTKHVIPNVGIVNTGSVEYFYAHAVSVSQLSNVLHSETNPYDIVHFDFSDVTCENGTSGREGKITYRKDPILNISSYYDFRNVKFRRWFNPAKGVYSELTNNGNASLDYHTIVNMSGTIHNIDIKPYVQFDAISSSYKPYYNNIVIGDTGSSNNIFDAECHDINISNYSSNNSFGLNCSDINLYSTSGNNTFGNYVKTVKMSGNNNSFGSGDSNINSDATLVSCIFGPGVTNITMSNASVLTGFKIFVPANNFTINLASKNFNNAMVDMIDSNGVLWFRRVDTSGNMTTDYIA